MPFVPHTPEEEKAMLEAAGASSMEDLFRDIPEEIRFQGELNLPPGAPEWEVKKRMEALAGRNRPARVGPFFLGGGTYLHRIPSIVDSLASRSEFVTAYTPYQPEASQGSLQAAFEYQTMISELTGLGVSNASMYDGASAVAEAACMMRNLARGKRKKLVLSEGLDPFAARTTRTYLANLDVEIVTAPLGEDGRTRLEGAVDQETFGVILGYPNFLGVVEDLPAAVETARRFGALTAVQTRLVPLGLLASPGECGADIACGDGAGLGTPPWFGGPSFGFFAAREEYVRRMPGRIVGQTVDRNGKRAFVLTFQPREQHIRREKATSNICTNHALMALRAAIHLAALGKEGLVETARACLEKAHAAAERLAALPGYSLAFQAPFFHEFALKCPGPAGPIAARAREEGVRAGIPLSRFFEGMDDLLLVAVTEWNTEEDIEALARALGGAS